LPTNSSAAKYNQFKANIVSAAGSGNFVEDFKYFFNGNQVQMKSQFKKVFQNEGLRDELWNVGMNYFITLDYTDESYIQACINGAIIDKMDFIR
jgi:hypothetical protein